MIYELLSTGKENAITGKRICAYLNIKARELTQLIEAERRAGKPICASTGKRPGYYLAANREEMKDYCQRLKHRGIEVFKTRKACLKTIDELQEEETESEQQEP